MSKSIRSFARKMNPLGKTHAYETQAQLDKLTAEDIINLSPSQVGFHIADADDDGALIGDKKRAMYQLLSMKREEKRNPSLRRGRPTVRKNFMTSIDPRLTQSIAHMMNETASKKEHERMSQQVEYKTLQNRLLMLGDKKTIPYTKAEEAFMLEQLLESPVKRSDLGMGIKKKGNTRKRTAKPKRVSNKKKSTYKLSSVKKKPTGTRRVKKH